MNIKNKVGVITGAAGGIGRAVALELANREIGCLALVDFSESVHEVCQGINEQVERPAATGYVGDVTDEAFRTRVYQELNQKHGMVNICVPAAGITRDSLAVKIDKETNRAAIYPLKTFRHVTEVNLIAPVYWALEMVADIAEYRRSQGLKRWEPEEGLQGTVIFMGRSLRWATRDRSATPPPSPVSKAPPPP